MSAPESRHTLDRATLRKRAYRDAAAIILLGIALFLVSTRLHLFNSLVAWSEEHKELYLDGFVTIFIFLVVASLVFIMRRRNELLTQVLEREKAEAEKAQLVPKLHQALDEVRTLTGLLPICAWCRKIRDDTGYWSQLEEYIQRHTDAEFTHGICPECALKVHSGHERGGRRGKHGAKPDGEPGAS